MKPSGTSLHLYCKKFTVITDHRALMILMTVKRENRRLDNWSMKLSKYQFKIVYRKGADNMVADCLSRCHGKEGYVADGEHQH